MTVIELVRLALMISVATLVFAVGLGTTPKELTYLLRRPGQLVRSVLSMNLVMLLVAVVIVKVFPLDYAVKILLVALALSPVGALIPKRLAPMGVHHEYMMALQVTAAVLVVAWIPLERGLLDQLFPAETKIPLVPVMKVASITVLGPTLAGAAVRALAPRVAERAEKPLQLVGLILLVVPALLILFKLGPTMLAEIGNGTLLALIAFVAVGLASGHLLGGPTASDRSVLSMATAARHPAIALTIAHAAFPEEKGVPAAVLLYLITSTIATVPYLAWRKKVHAREASAAATPAH